MTGGDTGLCDVRVADPACPPGVGHTGAVSEPTARDAVTLDVASALELLRLGTMEVEGRLVDASNTTLYCSLSRDGLTAACVYKPVRGERPLWDFPDGTLAAREAAAYVVSDRAGVERGAPDGAAGRPVRRGHGAAVDRR